MEQPEYNMLLRDRFENDYRILYEKYNYGTCTWAPLAGGILAGRYNNGEFPVETRMGDDPYRMHFYLPGRFTTPEKKAETLKMLNGLG
jgi:aryl-alcohol dehydrogenase-like predicted oxidoreductase